MSIGIDRVYFRGVGYGQMRKEVCRWKVERKVCGGEEATKAE
jgi:hypothetical protein